MRRRSFLKGALASLLAAPVVAEAAKSSRWRRAGENAGLAPMSATEVHARRELLDAQFDKVVNPPVSIIEAYIETFKENVAELAKDRTSRLRRVPRVR